MTTDYEHAGIAVRPRRRAHRPPRRGRRRRQGPVRRRPVPLRGRALPGRRPRRHARSRCSDPTRRSCIGGGGRADARPRRAGGRHRRPQPLAARRRHRRRRRADATADATEQKLALDRARPPATASPTSSCRPASTSRSSPTTAGRWPRFAPGDGRLARARRSSTPHALCRHGRADRRAVPRAPGAVRHLLHRHRPRRLEAFAPVVAPPRRHLSRAWAPRQLGGEDLLDALEGGGHVLARGLALALHHPLGKTRLLGDVPDSLTTCRPRPARARSARCRPPTSLPAVAVVCQAMRRFSSNSITVLTIEYGMPTFIDMPNC